MELTKQDKKHIRERVNKLSFRIADEANEYARLYEKSYYEKVIEVFNGALMLSTHITNK